MKRLFPIIIALLAFTACDHRKDLSDAYGNFEANDVIVSAEATGKLLSFKVEEGIQVDTAVQLGLIDTASTALQLQQLEAQQAAVNSKIAGVTAQINTLKQQKANLQINIDRVANLLKTGAATQQTKDDLDGQMKLIDKQIDASKTQIASIQKESSVMDAQRELLLLQQSKCAITSPAKGVILEKYINEGELAVAGKPLFKVADLSTLELRCYIPGDKLSALKIGNNVTVLYDSGKETMEKLQGTVSWISNEAEFTPKIIQTKKERVKLVYAVKVKVANDGSLKIGMPGEMQISQ
jgi:HlyD family secretion protein